MCSEFFLIVSFVTVYHSDFDVFNFNFKLRFHWGLRSDTYGPPYFRASKALMTHLALPILTDVNMRILLYNISILMYIYICTDMQTLMNVYHS